MEKVTFINSQGLSVVLGNEGPFVLTKIEGTGAVAADMQTQKSPFQDGVTYIDSTLEPRPLSLEVMLLAENAVEMERHRRKLLRVFNAKLGPGRLVYEFGGNVKEIEAKPEIGLALPDAGDFKETMQPGLISLYCPSPFWLDTYSEEKEMAAWIGGLSFPLRLPTTFAKEGQEQIFNNDGDVATPIIAEFYGPATNPRLDNLTLGEFIRIKRDLLAGEKLIINTAFGNKRVTLVDADNAETNAMHWIDLDSAFWQLRPGENRIKYNADAGVDKARVKVSWRNRYVGV